MGSVEEFIPLDADRAGEVYAALGRRKEVITELWETSELTYQEFTKELFDIGVLMGKLSAGRVTQGEYESALEISGLE